MKINQKLKKKMLLIENSQLTRWLAATCPDENRRTLGSVNKAAEVWNPEEAQTYAASGSGSVFPPPLPIPSSRLFEFDLTDFKVEEEW